MKTAVLSLALVFVPLWQSAILGCEPPIPTQANVPQWQGPPVTNFTRFNGPTGFGYNYRPTSGCVNPPLVYRGVPVGPTNANTIYVAAPWPTSNSMMTPAYATLTPTNGTMQFAYAPPSPTNGMLPIGFAPTTSVSQNSCRQQFLLQQQQIQSLMVQLQQNAQQMQQLQQMMLVQQQQQYDQAQMLLALQSLQAQQTIQQPPVIQSQQFLAQR